MKTEARCTCPAASTLTGPGRTALEAASALLRAHVHRPEAAQHVVDDLRGLLTEVERKNGWQPAEAAGYAHPRGMQRVLDRYVWQADEGVTRCARSSSARSAIPPGSSS